MKRLLAPLVFALVLVGFAPARAATPSTLSFAGRLTTAAGPVEGTASVTFTIFDAQTAGANLWTETHATLTVDKGLVFAELGSITPIAPAFEGNEAWLELVVNGELLSPRVKLLAVPYALHAGTAETADSAASADTAKTADKLGTLAEADVQKKLSAGNGVAINGTTVSLSTSGCTTGQVLKFNGTGFSCAAPPGFSSCAWKVFSAPSSQNQSAVCPTGKVAISGGCAPATIGIKLVTSRPFPPSLADGAPSASGWECFFDTIATNTAYAYCCTLN